MGIPFAKSSHLFDTIWIMNLSERISWLADAIRSLSRGQIIVLAAVVVVSFMATYGIYSRVSSSGEQSLEENQRLIPIRTGDLVNEVAINGSIRFANTAVLSFGSQGTVEEVLVDEGQEVVEGQPLVRLDRETAAQLQVAYAQANLDYMQAKADLDAARASNLTVAEAGLELQTALDELEALVGPNPQILANAEQSAADSAIALRDAQDAYDDVSEPSAAFVAEAEAVVAEAAIVLRDAEQALGKDAISAGEDVTAAIKDLSAAKQDLTIAMDSRSVDSAQSELDKAQQEYANAIKKWSGAILTKEELLLPSEELFEAWDFDPQVIYKTGYDLFPSGIFGDDPNTRWNELSVYGWVALHPSGGSIEVTCDTETNEVAVTTAGRSTLSAAQEFCIQRDTENTWERLQESRLEFDTEIARADKNLSQAEVAVLRAEEDLADAENAFKGLDAGPESDLLRHKFVIAAQALADAQQDLDAALDRDPLELNRVSATLAAAQAAHDDAMEALDGVINPDPMEVAIAQAVVDKAQRIADTSGALYQMELALEEAKVASAEALLNGARLRFEDSTLTAPWSGFVSTVHVEAGEVVQATTEIVEVIDPSIVEVEGIVDEIDVLSLTRGARAEVTMDALPGQTLAGVVSTISSAASNQQGVVTFDVEITVDVPGGLRLQEGLSALANVALSQERGLLVPNDAIHGTFSEPQVLVSSNGSLEERSLVLGNSDGFWTLVQEGLVEGEQVVMEVRDADAQQLGFRGFRGGGGGGNTGGGGGGGGGAR